MRPRTGRSAVLTLGIGLLLALNGCRRTPIGKDCAREDLPEGALMARTIGGGIAGIHETRTVYSDGRVVETKGHGPKPSSASIVVTPERIRQLEADLGRSGVFEVPEGCWKTSGTVSDGVGASVVLRRDGRLFSYSGGDMPSSVGRASALLNTFDGELSAAFARGSVDGGSDGGSDAGGRAP